MDPAAPHSAGACWAATLAMFALAAASQLLSHHGLGGWSTAAALAIAGLMAAIIAGVFFGLGRKPASNRLVLATAMALVLILVGFMTADVLLR